MITSWIVREEKRYNHWNSELIWRIYPSELRDWMSSRRNYDVRVWKNSKNSYRWESYMWSGRTRRGGATTFDQAVQRGIAAIKGYHT